MDCIPSTIPIPPDIFDIFSLCLLEHTLDFDFHTYLDVTSHEISRDLAACMVADLSCVNLLPVDATVIFPMIFDSGASLAISFVKEDFVGPIHPLKNRQLGGLTNRLNITSITHFQ